MPEENSFLSQNFFPANIEVDASRLFPMLVIATMSSGKSTLINALLGQQILPSQNKACTSKMYSILDDDTNSNPKIYITTKDGVTIEKVTELEKELENANNDENVSDIFIQGHVKGVLNTDRALLVVDTPGPNNARDLSHGKTMEMILNKVNGGLILYVINATQIAINDDKYLLNSLKKYMLSHQNLKLLFVVNKIDQIDEEQESIEEIMKIAKSYLNLNGFENANIIPVSALAASIFKKVLNREQLTRAEYRMFESCYELYQPKGFNMRSFAITEDYPNQFDIIEVRGIEYKAGDLIRALENTGIKLLEEMIQKEQILSGGQFKHTLRLN